MSSFASTETRAILRAESCIIFKGLDKSSVNLGVESSCNEGGGGNKGEIHERMNEQQQNNKKQTNKKQTKSLPNGHQIHYCYVIPMHY